MNGRRLGNLTIARALEMVMPFDRAAFFPGTRLADWEPYRELLEPNAWNYATDELQFPMQSYVVRTSHHTVLIDACVGNHKERPHREAWHQRNDGGYMDALAALGLTPVDVDYVMCTHLHTDHVGWNTRLDNGRWVPTFPNARYIFSKSEFDAWDANCDPKFTRTHFDDSVLPIVLAGRADLVTNDYALDNEIWLAPTPGHTPDHVSINFASNGHTAVMCGDLMHSPVQLAEPDWVPWPDFDADLAAKTRRAFCERYCDTSTLVCTAHFPLPSAGRIVRTGNAFGFEYEDGSW
jgi:glyoxylase-like metal-dependent hydrolase (beta-lactamase superfamily II)